MGREASIYLLTFLSQIKKVNKAAFERKPFVGHKKQLNLFTV